MKRKSKKQQAQHTASHMILAITATSFLVLACNGQSYQKQKQQDAKKRDLSIAEIISKTNCDPKITIRDGCPPKPAKKIKTADNNAGNLRYSNGEFRKFSTPKQGYNALVEDIKVKISGDSRMMKAKLGNNYKPTLKNIITVYAPPHENDTKHYIKFVAERAKINPNKVLTPKYAYKIVPHMIVMEKGHKEATKFQQYASIER